MKKHLAILTVLTFCFLSGAAINAATGFFPDVPSNAWFAQYVNAIKDWGVIDGNDDGTFAPGDNINRAQFAKMLYQYDKRVDKKIANSSTGTTTSSSKPYSIMYMSEFNAEPNKCPSGWTQISYGNDWEEAGTLSWQRICITEKNCSVVHLDKINGEPSPCPQGWSEANYGIDWVDSSQKNQYERICYICS